jgi:hypothetical protein
MVRSLLATALLPLSAVVAARNARIPAEEIDVLVLAVAMSVMLANTGQAAEGYLCLRAAGERAGLARGGDQPGAEELWHRYQEALLTFARRYGIALD